MKISIITPSFNSEKTIEHTIQSIQKQNYRQWEHIIIDGRSTDNTIQLLKKYNHLRWVSEPDNGIYDAMNKGIRMAKGDWLYFLGADDYLLNEKVLCQVTKYLNRDIDIIYGNVFSTRFNGFRGESITLNKLVGRNICHQAIFFRKKVFDIVGNFNLKYKSQADWDHNLRWFGHAKIRSQYIPVNIACFSDGGFSSNNPDMIFQQDKIYNLLKYSKHYNKTLYISQIARKYLKLSVRDKKFFLFLVSSKAFLRHGL